MDLHHRGGERSRAHQVAFGSGIVYVLLGVAARAFVPRSPATGSPLAQIVAYYADHRAGLLLFAALNGIAGLFALLFLAGLFDVLRRAEGDSGALALLAFGSGVAAATVLAGSYAVAGAAARVAGAGGAPEVIRALRELRSMAIDFAAIPLAVSLAAAALVILRTRVAPRWLGWLGLATALPNLASVGAIYTGSAALEQAGYLGLGFVLFALWVLATSFALLRRPRAAREPAVRSRAAPA